MDQEIFDWILMLARWVHITVAVTWIGTSIFFMWLDRTFTPNPDSKNPGHVGEVWMVHGGGFYHVEKLLMGPTKVPDSLHWFKWESYWTWMSGVFLLSMIFYTEGGIFLLDDTISSISYPQAVALGIFSVIGSWFFYDFLWERKLTKHQPKIGHLLTIAWFAGMSYILCHTLSGRAAYIHIGAMLGTWMTANVFMRIIPRQILMVEASKKGEPVNQDWGKNAKNRSTHNTYFTLPVIFIMLSNHFPATYGHESNWTILLLLCAAGAAVREYFVVRLQNPGRSKLFGAIGIVLILGLMIFSREEKALEHVHTEIVQVHEEKSEPVAAIPEPEAAPVAPVTLKGTILFDGIAPKGRKLNLSGGCNRVVEGDLYSNEVIVNNGKVQNVLIRITKGLEGKTFSDIPEEAVELDQKGCIYHPRLIAARVGQKVTFINSDMIFHNVKAVTERNPKFNLAMPKKDQRETKIFNEPEIFLQTKCSVHPWMSAHIAIIEHPYFDISDESGEFEIKDLPPGTYTFEAWHEVFGTQEQTITIGADSAPTLSFTFKK
jgi:uncharacterized membrane protein/plastocyanin